MDLGIAGRGCVVTGASRGIGLETAKQLCAEGAGVVLVGRDEPRLAAAVAECEAAASASRLTGRKQHQEARNRPVDERAAVALALDVTDEDAGERMVAAAEEAFGSLDVLVNNAGIASWRDVDEVPVEDWRAQYELNVVAPLQAIRAAAPAMLERGWGRIVNVCSTAGKRPSASMPEYSVAKAAELSLSRLFADRYAGRGVLVNAVCPGPTESEMWIGEGGLGDEGAAAGGTSRAEMLEAMGGKRPIGRLATPEEIAAAIVFLCSERASYVAGAAWSVDGGTVQVII